MASSVAAISSCVAPTRRVIMNERSSGGRSVEPASVAGVVRLTFLWSNGRRTLRRHRPPNPHRPTTYRPFAVLLSLSRHQRDDAGRTAGRRRTGGHSQSDLIFT